MNGRYERLILDLEPWLRGVLREKGVPGANYLKALGDDGQHEGQDGGEAADVRAEVMKKALGVARDIESGDQRPPAKPEQYFKQVMRYALMDWFRSHPKTASLSPDERALIDNVLHSIDKGEGDEGLSGFPTIPVPADSSAIARPSHPLLLTLAQQRWWWQPDVGAEYEQAQRLLDDIPDEHRREVVLLDLQGYRQEQIAVKVLRTQQAVSKALREQHAAWGWDRKQVRRVQYVMAYANLIRLFGRVFPNGGFAFPLSRPLYFFEDHRPAFHLPGREFEGEGHDRDERWKSDPQQGSKERRQRQRRISHSKVQDSMLYKAIMNDPALAPWTDGLELRHMPQVIAQVIDW